MVSMPRTKIIVTYGPSIADDRKLREILKQVDIIRLNFSHGALEEKLAAIRKIRKLSREIGREVAILADLPGPKIRVSRLEREIPIRKGQRVVLCYSKKARGSEVPTDFDMYKGMRKESEISIGDGEPKLLVTELSKGRIICKAMQDGAIGSRKGINVKGSSINAEPPTGEDMKFAKFAMENDLDFIALSFVKSAKDIARIRKVVDGMGVISKIERQEAIDGIEGIAEASDGIMIARGDMALNIDYSKVPLMQDRIIRVCRSAKKPVIVATQMLESMLNNRTPTRAEMTDVANAVKSGVDCVMLSGETAIGNHPVEAVTALSNILSYTEQEMPSNFTPQKSASSGHEGIAAAAAGISHTCDMDIIFVPTHSGTTVRMLSGMRPDSTVVALSSSDKVRRSLGLYYGVVGVRVGKHDGSGESVDSEAKIYARRMNAKNYMLIYGHQANGSTSDSIKCFWGKSHRKRLRFF